MKICLTIFVLLFSFSLVAEDISDFQIEGISILDSALDYFTEEEIKNNTKDYYNSKIFTPVENMKLSSFKTYDVIDFSFLSENFITQNKKNIIHSLNGILIYENNVENCYKKMDEIDKELLFLFKNAERRDKYTYKHSIDKTGKSTITDIHYVFKKGLITIACYDYSKKSGYQDHLRVAIRTNKFLDWLQTAYD